MMTSDSSQPTVTSETRTLSEGPVNQATDRYPHPYPYGYMPIQRRTNGLAIASLVLGITWIWWVGSLLAVIFGIVAHRQINQSNGTQTGGGMATAGIVLGWLGIVVFVLFMVFAVALSATSPTSY